MKTGLVLKSVALAVLLATAANSQEEQPPDQKALNAATKITDPLKQIEALEDFLAKYPKSELRANAYRSIFQARLKADPTHRAMVLGSANNYVAATKRENRKYAFDSVAAALLDTKVFLPEAERYARRALAEHRLGRYMAESRAQALKAKRPVPTEEEMLFWFNQDRSFPLATASRLAFALGRNRESRRLGEEALRYRPLAAGVHSVFAEMDAQNGLDESALNHLLVAHLTGGRVLPQHQPLFDRLFAAKYGSKDKLEGILDELYRNKFPSPLHVTRYKPPPERKGRVVLAEFFTGAGCPPCAAADLAFDAVLERYTREEVALLVYHQHIPRPDPMAFVAASNRFKEYKRGGVPTFVVDGDKDGGGGPRDYAPKVYDRINPKIEKRLLEAPSAEIELSARRERNAVVVQAAVAPVGGDKRDLRLHLVLVEKMLRYSGENGIRMHPMVVRSIAGPESAAGFNLRMGERFELKHQFDLDAISADQKKYLLDYEREKDIKFLRMTHGIDAYNTAVVAFVQDAGSMAVLQATYVDVGPTATAAR